MFDPQNYREACSQLTLGQEKIEEMISMTEDRKRKRLHRPARVLLVAAALAGALCVTAAAAEVPAVKEFFATVFVSISVDDKIAAGISLPSVAVEKQEERTILHVNGEEIDVTDALAREGAYLYEGDGFTVEVDKDGVATATAYGADGTVVSYTTDGAEGEETVYHVASDVEGGDAFEVYATGEEDGEWKQYEIDTYQSGAVDIYSIEEK